MRLLLIRHAQSGNNAVADASHGDYSTFMATRSPDPALTPAGERQAELLATYVAAMDDGIDAIHERMSSYLRLHPVTRLYVSPMLRALQTAQPLAAALELAPEVWVDIHEHGGIFTGSKEAGNVLGYPGLTCAAIAARFPTYTTGAGIDDRGWWRGGYEELEECDARAGRVAHTLRTWAGQQPDATIALVTHGTFLNSLLHALLTLPPSAQDRVYFSHLNTALTRIDFLQDGGLAMRYHNRITHLPVEYLTR
jgi:broad specificity phosphatase PhoE